MAELKKTSLYDEHVELGGKIVDFGGWALPIQYEGLVPEHEAVREAAGLFDVSHMGGIFVTGKDSLPFLQHLVTNDISGLEDGAAIYTFMCYEDGGIVDDFLIYKYGEDNYMLVVNGANIEKDYHWILYNKRDFDVVVEDRSSAISILALQGPKAQEILQKLTDKNLDEIKPFHFDGNVKVKGITTTVSRTGYTGEDGFEIYVPNDEAVTIWRAILEEGKDLGIKPAALGARDTLRFEAGLPLYGNELSKEISPIEAGQKFFVKLDKEDFIGKDALQAQVDGGLTRRAVGFELQGRGIPRQGYEVAKDGKVIGFVTTGYMAPTLKKSIGFAIVDLEEAKLDNDIEILIRNKAVPAKTVKKRFYKR